MNHSDPTLTAADMSSSQLEEISDLASHDAAIALASSTCLVILFVVSEGNPLCKSTAPKVEALAAKHSFLNGSSSNKTSSQSHQIEQREVRIFKLPLTPKTTPFIKFGIQNTPIFICLKAGSCETLLGGNDKNMQKLEDMIQQHMRGD